MTTTSDLTHTEFEIVPDELVPAPPAPKVPKKGRMERFMKALADNPGSWLKYSVQLTPSTVKQYNFAPDRKQAEWRCADPDAEHTDVYARLREPS